MLILVIIGVINVLVFLGNSEFCMLYIWLLGTVIEYYLLLQENSVILWLLTLFFVHASYKEEIEKSYVWYAAEEKCLSRKAIVLKAARNVLVLLKLLGKLDGMCRPS